MMGSGDSVGLDNDPSRSEIPQWSDWRRLSHTTPQAHRCLLHNSAPCFTLSCPLSLAHSQESFIRRHFLCRFASVTSEPSPSGRPLGELCGAADCCFIRHTSDGHCAVGDRESSGLVLSPLLYRDNGCSVVWRRSLRDRSTGLVDVLDTGSGG